MPGAWAVVLEWNARFVESSKTIQRAVLWGVPARERVKLDPSLPELQSSVRMIEAPMLTVMCPTGFVVSPQRLGADTTVGSGSQG